MFGYNAPSAAHYPGVSPDGVPPGGLNVAGALSAQQVFASLPADAAGPSAASYGETNTGNGTYGVQGVSWDNAGGGSFIQQGYPTGNSFEGALEVLRNAPHGYPSNDYRRAVMQVFDNTPVAQAQPLAEFGNQGAGNRTRIEADGSITSPAGIGLYGANPPGASSVITGALSAVTDANAKTVLTSLIAAIIADGGATDTTT